MTYDITNLAMGPCDLYVGDYGATEPDDADVSATPSSADWTHVGGTSGGLTFSITEEFAKLRIDQVPMDAESRRTNHTVQAKVKLAENTHANLIVALNGGTSSSGGNYSKWEPSMESSAVRPTYKAVLIDGYWNGTYRRRVVLRKAINSDTVELEYTVDGQKGYQLTLDGHYVSDTIMPYAIIDQTA